MKLSSSSFGDNQRIPGAYAFAVPHATDHVTLSSNRNPQLELERRAGRHQILCR